MENSLSSLALVRRRRQARLRQSLHDATEGKLEESSDSDWIGLGDQNHIMCHSGFELVSKRREANARERLRVRNLNSGFAKLRRILPTVPPNRKPSKVDTLQGAIDYIYQLEKILESTGGIPNIKKSIGSTSHSHSRQSVTERPFIDDVFNEVTTQVAAIRYPPPFNTYDNPTCCLLCPERSPPPTTNSFPYNQNFAGMSYLTVPSHHCRLSPNDSNGLPSPTSSMTSDESHNNEYGGLHNMITDNNNIYTLPGYYPALHTRSTATNRHCISETAVRNEREESMYNEYEITGSREHDDIRENHTRLREHETSNQRDTYGDEDEIGGTKWEENMKEMTERNKSYFSLDENNNRSTLPPVSFLYGNNLAVDV